MFNITNSLLGGGTLSLPYVFAKCGVVTATTLLLLTASLTIFSLHIICTLSEKYGCSTYSEVIERTLGRRAKLTATYCLVLTLLLAIIAYLVLLRDVASEVFEYFMPLHYSLTPHPLVENTIITSLVVLVYPLMTADSLHALRYSSYCGTTCIVLLLVCMCSKALYRVSDEGMPSEVVYYYTTPSDILTALPITFIAYMCHFNINAVYCDLKRPQDIQCVVSSAVSSAAVFFIVFGVAGYVCASGATADNILKNFDSRDPVVMVARMGLTVTLMSQLPMMVVPCR